MNTSINHEDNLENTINLDDISSSFVPNNLQHPGIINLGDSSNFTTLVRSNN